jgi:hypothetical protein
MPKRRLLWSRFWWRSHPFWRRRRLHITPIVIRIVVGVIVRIVRVVPPVRITPPTISKSSKKAMTVAMTESPVMASTTMIPGINGLH